jgi:Ni/Co efflux regulator RcnB
MIIFTDKQIAKLSANHHRIAMGRNPMRMRPVIEMSLSVADATWYVVAADPTKIDEFIALCDIDCEPPRLAVVRLGSLLVAAEVLFAKLNVGETFNCNKTIGEISDELHDDLVNDQSWDEDEDEDEDDGVTDALIVREVTSFESGRTVSEVDRGDVAKRSQVSLAKPRKLGSLGLHTPK